MMNTLKINLGILLCALCFFINTASAGTWSPANGPSDGFIKTIVIDPTTSSTLYMGSQYGILKSMDGGNNWTAANTGLTNLNFSSIAIDPVTPSIIYAATWNGGVFKSVDGGGNWVASSGAFGWLRCLVIDPATPSTLYAGTGAGVYKSVDSGATWALAGASVFNSSTWTLGGTGFNSTSLGITSIAIDPVTPTTIYATTGMGVLKSVDAGVTWVAMNAGISFAKGLSLYSIAIDPFTPSIIYMGGYDAFGGIGIYKSIDSGATWAIANIGLSNKQVQHVSIDPVITSTLYAGTAAGVFKSMDSGASWQAMNTGIPSGYSILSIAINKVTTSTLYVGTSGGGAFKSVNGGTSWSTVHVVGLSLAVHPIAINPVTPSILYAGTPSGAVFQSVDGGGLWAGLPILGNGTIDSLAVDPVTASTIYAGSSTAGVLRSMDSGASWVSVDPQLGGGFTFPLLAIDPTSPSIFYASMQQIGLLKFTGGGTSWTFTGSGVIGQTVWSMAFDTLTPTIIYVGANNGVFKSMDSGTTWLAINTGLTTLDVRAMVIDPLIPSTLYAGTFGGGIFKSVDSGASWAAINTGLGNLNIQALAIDPATPSILYAGTAGGGVFQSVDGGTVWTAINTGLASLNVQSIAIDPLNPSIIYVGNLKGVQKGVFDMIAPVISLSGNANVSITQGTTYTDAGATATDNVDGNITANIAVVNPVNTAAVGTYTVTYNVSDAAGNAATQVVRTVKVVATGTTAGGSTTQLTLASGGTVTLVSTGQYISSFSAAATVGTIPSGMQFPFGMISYQSTSTVGGSQTVDMTFSSALPANTVLYKVDNAGAFTLIPKGAGANRWTQTNANTVAITLTDGGAFDLDGIANGVIVDPVVVGSPAAPVAAATTATSSGGGGGCSLNRSASFDPMMLMMMILSLVYLVRASAKK